MDVLLRRQFLTVGTLLECVVYRGRVDLHHSIGILQYEKQHDFGDNADLVDVDVRIEDDVCDKIQ